MMKFKNPTSCTLNLEPIGLGKVPPGGEIEVEECLYRPGLKANGSRDMSPIEMAAPQMVPVACGGWIEEWRKAPAPPAPVSRMVTVDTLHKLPPAIVEAREAFLAAQTAPAAAEPVAGPVEAPKPKRGRPPKARMDADVAASNPGVTSGILDTED